ncbi:hypothetical protein [Halomonas sp.]|uniref:hypothetical protein n=1 Tax=Halomonas sp. TaxID=1486246 RepID=UPI003568AC02
MNYELDETDDWVEEFRRDWYPRFHDPLTTIGEVLGIGLYSQGKVGYDQYVAELDEEEDTIELELDDVGFRRNPISALKSLPDGRLSEGSWVLLHRDAPDLVEHGMQLHVTLFQRDRGGTGRALYAHYEDDWRVDPLAHLRAKHLSTRAGVELTRKYLDENSYLVLKE